MAKTKVTMETSVGTITLELDGEKAPETVKNFVKYEDTEAGKALVEAGPQL